MKENIFTFLRCLMYILVAVICLWVCPSMDSMAVLGILCTLCSIEVAVCMCIMPIASSIKKDMNDAFLRELQRDERTKDELMMLLNWKSQSPKTNWETLDRSSETLLEDIDKQIRQDRERLDRVSQMMERPIRKISHALQRMQRVGLSVVMAHLIIVELLGSIFPPCIQTFVIPLVNTLCLLVMLDLLYQIIDSSIEIMKSKNIA